MDKRTLVPHARTALVVALALVACSSPKIRDVTPRTASPYELVTLGGRGLARASEVRFGGVRATTFRASDGKHLLAIVPGDAASGPISVLTRGGTAISPRDFVVRVTVQEEAEPNDDPDAAQRISAGAVVTGALTDEERDMFRVRAEAPPAAAGGDEAERPWAVTLLFTIQPLGTRWVPRWELADGEGTRIEDVRLAAPHLDPQGLEQVWITLPVGTEVLFALQGDGKGGAERRYRLSLAALPLVDPTEPDEARGDGPPIAASAPLEASFLASRWKQRNTLEGQRDLFRIRAPHAGQRVAITLTHPAGFEAGQAPRLRLFNGSFAAPPVATASGGPQGARLDHKVGSLEATVEDWWVEIDSETALPAMGTGPVPWTRRLPYRLQVDVN
jgi:hypothetical protein